MLQSFTDVYRKYADFSGRATRRQYWEWFLVYLLLAIGLAFLDHVTSGKAFFSNTFALVSLIPSFAVGARRLHDTGRSGWWQLILLVPFLGFLILIYFLCLPSSADNTYGRQTGSPGYKLGPGEDSTQRPDEKTPPKPPFIIKG